MAEKQAAFLKQFFYAAKGSGIDLACQPVGGSCGGGSPYRQQQLYGSNHADAGKLQKVARDIHSCAPMAVSARKKAGTNRGTFSFQSRKASRNSALSEGSTGSMLRRIRPPEAR